MKKIPSATVFIAALLPYAPSIAQTAFPKVTQAAPASSVVSAPGALVFASNEGSSVAIKVSKTNSELPQSRSPEEIKGGAKFTTWSLIAEAPISKAEKNKTLLSQEGFANATTLGISYMRFTTDWHNLTAVQEEEYKELCARMQQAATAPSASTPEKPKEEKLVDCSASNFAKYLPFELGKVRQLRPGPTPGGWIWGLAGKYGLQDSTYYDPVSLGKNTARNHPWSAGVFMAWNPASRDTLLLTLKLDRTRKFKDADSSVRCPAASSAPVQCVSGSFGEPKGNLGSVVTVDVRSLLTDRLAISASVSRDVSRNITTLEVPLYYLSNEAGGLTGGIKLGWNSEDKKAGVGVFVGVPFAAWQ